MVGVHINTAERIFKLLRQRVAIIALQETEKALEGECQVDDSYFGAYRVSINSDNNRISITAPSAELGWSITTNLPPPSFSFNSTTLGGSIINGGTSNGTISIFYIGGLGQSYSGISLSLSLTGVTRLTASLTGYSSCLAIFGYGDPGDRVLDYGTDWGSIYSYSQNYNIVI